jgi:hypothetical protein
MARRLRYSDALEGWDKAGILAALAEDVVIHVAVHDALMQGKEIADFLFGVLAEELGEMRISDEIVEGGKAVVLFETTIEGLSAQGLNVITLELVRRHRGAHGVLPAARGAQPHRRGRRSTYGAALRPPAGIARREPIVFDGWTSEQPTTPSAWRSGVLVDSALPRRPRDETRRSCRARLWLLRNTGAFRRRSPDACSRTTDGHQRRAGVRYRIEACCFDSRRW